MGYQELARLLALAGADVVFAMIGGTNVQWLAFGEESGLFDVVSTRHEDTAVAAASGLSRSTGRVGFATVTRGPGFVNALNALAAAAHSHVPVVLVVGESPPARGWTTQAIDQRALASVVGAGFLHVADISVLAEVVGAAVDAALWNGNPQVLSVSPDLLASTVGDLRDFERETLRPVGPEDVEAALDTLRNAEHPLVLAGRGAMLSRCRAELFQFADMIGARVASTLAANRFFDGHPYDLGVCGDFAPPPARASISQSDAVLAIGASLNRHTTSEGLAFPDADVIQVEIDPNQKYMATSEELAVLGDARAAVRLMMAEWARRGYGKRAVAGPTPSRLSVQAHVMDLDLGHDPKRGIDPRDVYNWVERRFPPDRIVVTDGGKAMGGALPTLVGARDAESWITGTSFGSVGQGLGLAIGAATAHPERPVVLFCGDGGFMMSIHGLDVVRSRCLRNLTIIVMNDEMLGSEAKYLHQYGLSDALIRMPLPAVPRLADAFDGIGHVVNSRDAFEEFPNCGESFTVIDARIDPIVDVRHAF